MAMATHSRRVRSIDCFSAAVLSYVLLSGKVSKDHALSVLTSRESTSTCWSRPSEK